MATATSGLISLAEEVSFSSDARIDEAAGVLRGVRLLGRHSKNGREYSDKAMREAAEKYEGVDVNINHDRSEKGRERKFDEAFGQIRNARVNGDGVYGDFHYLKSHPAAPRLVEVARRMPERLGFSHHAEGSARTIGGKTVVESVNSVRSVDLVQCPATNKGLWESFLWEDGALMPSTSNLPPDSPGGAIDGAADEGRSEARSWLLKTLSDLLDQTSLSPAKLRSFVAKAVDLMGQMEKLEQGAGGNDDEAADPKRGEIPESEEPKTRLWANFVTGKHERITESEWQRRQRACSFGGPEAKTDIFEAETVEYPKDLSGFVSQMRYTAPAIATGKAPRPVSVHEQRERHEQITGGRSYERIIEEMKANRPPACNQLVEALRHDIAPGYGKAGEAAGDRTKRLIESLG